MATGKVVFRSGSATSQNLTPRPGRDMEAGAAQRPGLSVDDVLPRDRKGQKIDVARLKPPLGYFPDDVAQGGRQGHGVIAPIGESGDVDQAALAEWASHRETQQDSPHPLTQLVLDAIIERNVRNII